MKVLGTKVNDETYNRFAALDGSISDNLKKAVVSYLDFIVNKPLTTHKANIPLRPYKEVTEIVDRLIEAEK
jgi:hypothetical protein